MVAWVFASCWFAGVSANDAFDEGELVFKDQMLLGSQHYINKVPSYMLFLGVFYRLLKIQVFILAFCRWTALCAAFAFVLLVLLNFKLEEDSICKDMVFLQTAIVTHLMQKVTVLWWISLLLENVLPLVQWAKLHFLRKLLSPWWMVILCFLTLKCSPCLQFFLVLVDVKKHSIVGKLQKHCHLMLSWILFDKAILYPLQLSAAL